MILYQRLGVKKDATTEQVKKAYRRKAKKLHPDRGGDAEKFREVHIAFEVLSDPERRRRYDETGEYDEIVAPTPAIDPELNTLLYSALMDAVFPDQETPFQPPENVNPKKSDIKKRVLKELDKARGLIKEKKKVVNVQIAKFRLMKERFTTEGEFNYFEGVIDANIGNWERGLEQLERQLQKVKEAEDFVEGYKYRTDEGLMSPGESMNGRMLPEATFTFRFAATNEENK